MESELIQIQPTKTVFVLKLNFQYLIGIAITDHNQELRIKPYQHYITMDTGYTLMTIINIETNKINFQCD